MTNHEHPNNGNEPTPRGPLGPDPEGLESWDSDLTGTVPQDNSQRDVINDAILEATSSGSEIPDWGARTIARYLANRSGDRDSHLHHFAVAGRADPDRISRELAELYSTASTTAEEREWINWLGTYLLNRPDPSRVIEEGAEHVLVPGDAPVGGSAVDNVSHYLQEAFRAADARGEAISADDARAIAALLAPLLGTDSELARFAQTGEGDHHQLLLECLALTGRTRATPEIGDSWIPRLEQYLARNPQLPDPESTGMDAEPTTGQAAEGIRRHGDAFRAYLALDDVDPSRDDLLQSFTEFYVGSFASMDDLLEELTEIRDWERAIAELAGHWGIDDLVSLDRSKVEHIARLTWDIVELDGHLYAFSK